MSVSHTHTHTHTTESHSSQSHAERTLPFCFNTANSTRHLEVETGSTMWATWRPCHSAGQQWPIRTKPHVNTALSPWRVDVWTRPVDTPMHKEKREGRRWLLCYLKSSWLVVESARLWFHAPVSTEASDLRQSTVYSSPGEIVVCIWVCLHECHGQQVQEQQSTTNPEQHFRGGKNHWPYNNLNRDTERETHRELVVSRRT